MKLCGCKEPCFVNGEKVWGAEGGVLCLHASEKADYINGGSFGICGITGESVKVYIYDWQYKEAQQQVQADSAEPHSLT